MATIRKTESAALLIGDIAVFVISLWVTLIVRYAGLPRTEDFLAHLAPFSLLFIVWIIVFFIAGLYDKNSLLIKANLPQRLLSAHLFNVGIAVIFFYAVPYFGIAPKLTLFLYLLISTLIIVLWRFSVYPKFAKTKANKIIVLAEGKDVDELVSILESNKNSLIKIDKLIKPTEVAIGHDRMGENNGLVGEAIKKSLSETKAQIVAIDLMNPLVQKEAPSLYPFIFSGVQFIEVQDLYEEVTDRVPLGLINETWFLEYASIKPNFIYDAIKRLMDIIIATPLALVSIIFYPFVWVAIKIEDRGPVFIYQDRVGQNDKTARIVKFRSMSVSDEGKWVQKHDPRVTKVGKFIRKSRIDELPQLWNIIRGDISLIGPRPELPPLVELYKKEIPHYNVRHLIKPGLSGWAQIHHEKPPHSVEETFEKLSYDLYYIKHRSLWLDLRIALQTIKTLLSRVGI